MERTKKNLLKIGILFISIGAICLVSSFTLFIPDTPGPIAISFLGGITLGSGIVNLLIGIKR